MKLVDIAKALAETSLNVVDAPVNIPVLGPFYKKIADSELSIGILAKTWKLSDLVRCTGLAFARFVGIMVLLAMLPASRDEVKKGSGNLLMIVAGGCVTVQTLSTITGDVMFSHGK